MKHDPLSLDELWLRLEANEESGYRELFQHLNGWIVAESKVNGVVNEDRMQDIRIALYEAIQREIRKSKKV